MQHIPSTRLLASCAVALLAVGCKFTTSSVSEYEQAAYAGKDVCELVRDEASRRVKERRGTFDEAYKEVFAREASIFTLLVPKARLCAGARAPVEAKPAMPAPDGARTGAANASGVEIDAGARVPASQDPECEGLADPARLADLEAKLRRLKSCDPSTTKITGPDAPAATPGESSESAPSEVPPELALVDEVPINSDVCDAIGLDSKGCQAVMTGGIQAAALGVEKACFAAGAFLKNQELGKLDSAGARECGAEVVYEVCSRYAVLARESALAANDGSRSLNQKLDEFYRASVKQTSRSFTSSVTKCVIAYGKDRAKALVQDAAKDAMQSAFSSRIASAETWLNNQTHRAVIGAACAVGAGIAEYSMGKYEAKDINAECKDLWAHDKQRAQACVKSVKDVGCDALLSGRIDLTTSFHIGDSNKAGQLFAELTSGALEATCSGAGRVGSAACSLIAKSSGYIADAFRGKSNPWADCLGTPAMGACVADYWHYWSTGILVDDYKVGIADSKKAPDEQYYNDVCWCWRKCMSNDWGTDREIHRDLYWEKATKGDAGVRFCASKERELKWPTGLTWESGRRNVYIQYTSCGVSRARGPGANLWDDKGYMEIFADGKWGWYKFPRNAAEHYMGCGGKADRGI